MASLFVYPFQVSNLMGHLQILKWLPYVPGLCDYPDVHLIIKRSWRRHFIPLPCFGHIFSCAAGTGRWLEMKVGVWSMRENQWEMLLLSQSLWGEEKECSGERCRWILVAVSGRLVLNLLLCLNLPLVCQCAVGVLTVANTNLVPGNLWLNWILGNFKGSFPYCNKTRMEIKKTPTHTVLQVLMVLSRFTLHPCGLYQSVKAVVGQLVTALSDRNLSSTLLKPVAFVLPPVTSTILLSRSIKHRFHF